MDIARKQVTSRILIVGNSGFLAKRLFGALTKDFRIFHTQRFDENRELYLDLLAKPRKWRVPFDEFDYVIQTAGVGGEIECKLNPINSLKVNVESNAAIAKALVRAEKNLIFVSSSYVYDFRPQNSNDKSAFPYTYQKMLAEKHLSSILQNLTIVRPGRVLGVESFELIEGVKTLQNRRTLLKMTNTRLLPIHIDYFTKLIVQIIKSNTLGHVNFSSDRAITPYEFWKLLAYSLGLDSNLVLKSEPNSRDRISDDFIRESYFNLQQLSLFPPPIEDTVKCLADEFLRQITF